MTSKRIQHLKEKIADLKNRWPAHSPSPALLQELDELEEEMAREVEKRAQEREDA